MSEWGSPKFIEPENNGIVISFFDFRRIKIKIISRKPFHIPKMKYFLLNIEVFMHALSLDLITE